MVPTTKSGLKAGVLVPTPTKPANDEVAVVDEAKMESTIIVEVGPREFAPVHAVSMPTKPEPVKPEPPTQVPEIEKHPVVSDMPEAKLDEAAPVRVRLPIVPVANVKLVTNRLVVEATEEKKAVVVAWEVVALRAVKFWRVVEDVLRT